MDSFPLTPLGEKILLDRYALKDTTRKTLAEGDKVLVITNKETGQREIGVIDGLWLERRIAMVKFEDEISTKVFSIEDIDKPLEVTPQEIMHRVAKAVANVERMGDRERWSDEFYDIMKDWKFVPAGRILAAAGNPGELTFFNCFVLPSPEDSREGIFKRLSEMAEIMSRGGGVGMNLSSLRPRKAYVKGVNGRSSGSVSWGSLFSTVTGLIEQGGSRRGALMLILNDWHPDIYEFINSKRKAGQITNANISVAISDDFMKAVEDDDVWSLRFPDTTDVLYEHGWYGDMKAWLDMGGRIIEYKEVMARELWDTIIESAHKSAEPGIWFSDRSADASNSWYFNPLIATNPCGEQPLPAWSVCNLGAINLSQFWDENDQVNWYELGRVINIAVRFLDNVIDATPYFYEENEIQQKKERRIGLNTMGLAELLIKCKIRYGSDESIEFIDALYEFIATQAYMASSDLAAMRGPFPAFDTSKFLESEYVRALPVSVRSAIERNGIRNVTLLTQAPNGTIGTMVGTSTGIEPFFSFSWKRKSRLGTHEEFMEMARPYAMALERYPDYMITAGELSPKDHVMVQATIQRWIDSAISKTVNMPSHARPEDVADVYRMMYDYGCKGGTVYRDQSRDDQVLSASINRPLELVKARSERPITFQKYGDKVPILDNPDPFLGGMRSDLYARCPECAEETLLHESGCETCTACGYSLCKV